MRYAVGLVVVASALTQGLTAAADPPDTVKLNTQRTETPKIRILGASDAGMLYTVQHPDLGVHLPPGDPSGLETVTWLKPAGKPAVRVGREFEDLHGNYVFAISYDIGKFRRIDTAEIRTCTSLPGQKVHFATGWLHSAGGNYRLTTIGPTGCSTRLLAIHQGTFLQAADENGFVVSAGNQLKYASYAAPATLKTIAMGNQHGGQATQVTPSGDTVAWTIQSQSRNWVFRGSTHGAAPTESVVDRQVTSIAVTPTHTGWASDEYTTTLRPSNLFGTIPTGSTTSTERAGTGSVVSDGSQFVVDAVSTEAGPHRTPNASVRPTLIQAVDKMAPLGGLVAIGAGRVVYTDSRGTGTAQVIRRGYRQGHPLVLGAESTVTAGAYTLSQDGRRTALLTRTGVWLLTEAGKTRWLAKPVAEPRMLGGVRVSGTRVMWAVFRPGPVCEPTPSCPPPYPEWVYLYDARTQRTSRIPGGRHTVYGLWGNYFLAGKADGSIYRRDLSRSLGCATQTGRAIASWDGRDHAGRRMPNGRYTWTFNGRDADGWLLWWNGSGRPITGTVTVF